LTAVEEANPNIANQIYQSEEVQLRLLDYANQFSLDTPGQMTSYLSGLAANTTLTGLMIRNYILFNTEEGRLHPDALRNREDRLDGAIAGFATGVDPLDMPVVDLSQDFTGGLNGTNINVVDGVNATINGTGDRVVLAGGAHLRGERWCHRRRWERGFRWQE
jgi:hypothetical protein